MSFEETSSESSRAQASPQREEISLLPSKLKGERQNKETEYLQSGHTHALQMPLRETRAQIYLDEPDQVRGGKQVYSYLPFSIIDLLNWKHHNPSYTEKPQSVIDTIRSIFPTHNPTWTDCQQLLVTLFSTEERHRVVQAALHWLEINMPEGTNDPRHYAEARFPDTDPNWDPNDPDQFERLQRYREVLLNGRRKAMNIGNIGEVLQKTEESPSQFYERLCEAYRLYTPFDPEAAENQRMTNIRRKLQKLEWFDGKNATELISIATQVLIN
ncbi:LOW QUALITY PROTEIN: hypothetical protein AAY473_039348 [Plecturocebus cupreus]